MDMTYPNERDCKHGNLRRSCEICGLDSVRKEGAREALTDLSLWLADRTNPFAEVVIDVVDEIIAKFDQPKEQNNGQP